MSTKKKGRKKEALSMFWDNGLQKYWSAKDGQVKVMSFKEATL